MVNDAGHGGVDRGLMIFQNTLPADENDAARRLYSAECDDNLSQVSRLLDGLDRMGLADDTIVVFTADHGHALGDHDYYFHHGEFLYESSLRVPLLVRWPGHLPAGRVVEEQVRTIDIAPTLYGMLDMELPAKMDGVDARGYLDGKKSQQDAFLEFDVKMFPANLRRGLIGVLGKLRALRTDRYKLIMNPTHKGARFELYDIIDDPEEREDLSDDPTYTGTLSSLKERLLVNIPAEEREELDGLRSESADDAQSGPPKLTATELEMLRSLDYVQ